MPDVIKSLNDQENVAYSDYEVIVVDNRSTDDTQKVITSMIKKYHDLQINAVIENEQGLSYARNRGYREARYDYVGYIDDDALAQPNWIAKAIDIIQQHEPDAFGGPIYPFYINEKPDWFKDEYEIRIHRESSGWMSGNDTFSGSNMIWKKTLLKSLGGFDAKLGMVGNRVAYGEETALVNYAIQKGYHIYYELGLVIRHLVPHYKFNFIYFLNQQLQQAQSIYSDEFINKEIIDERSYIIDATNSLESIMKVSAQYVEKNKSGEADQTQVESFFIDEVLPLFIPLIRSKTALEAEIRQSRSLRGKLIGFSLKNLLIRLGFGKK